MSDKEFNDSLKKIRAILDVVEGKEDIKKRIEILLRPEKPQTSSKISLPQVSYVQDAYWSAKIWSSFKGLAVDADELLQSMLSHEGFGVKSTIDLQKALTGTEKETVVQKETFSDKVKKMVKGEGEKQ